MTLPGWLDRAWPSVVALLGTLAVVGLLLAVWGGEVDPVDDGLDDEVAAGESPTPSPTLSPSPTAAPQRAPVVVLNQTGVPGLAATTGDALEQAGWEVVEVGSFPSGVPETTVYYPPDLEAAAQAMDEEWDGIDRLRPVFSGLSDEALTLILAETDQPPVPAGQG